MNASEAAEGETAAETNASVHGTFLAPHITAPNADTFMTTEQYNAR